MNEAVKAADFSSPRRIATTVYCIDSERVRYILRGGYVREGELTTVLFFCSLRIGSTRMKFIDLFAGLGGFHQALASRGGECVFASELNGALAGLYKSNFGIEPAGDIRDVDPEAIPDHDILCAGFPCQPFSKAGDQKGLECPQWGNDGVEEKAGANQPFTINDATAEGLLRRLFLFQANRSFPLPGPI